MQCKCLRCGSLVVVRDDRFSKSNIPVSCTYCYPDYTSKKVRQRYETLHHLSGYEYEHDKQIRARLSSLKQGAVSRNLSFSITDEEAKNILNQKCYYCNEDEYIGIDRIDSKKGYTLENCVPCCKFCNLMKNKLP